MSGLLQIHFDCFIFTLLGCLRLSQSNYLLRSDESVYFIHLCYLLTKHVVGIIKEKKTCWKALHYRKQNFFSWEVMINWKYLLFFLLKMLMYHNYSENHGYIITSTINMFCVLEIWFNIFFIVSNYSVNSFSIYFLEENLNLKYFQYQNINFLKYLFSLNLLFFINYIKKESLKERHCSR